MFPLVLALALPAHASRTELMEQYGTIEPRRLTVHLDLDPAETSYAGTSKITLEHSKPVDEIVVHAADGLRLTLVQFTRGSRVWGATVTPLGEERYAIRPSRPIAPEGLTIPRKRAAMRGESLFAKPSFLTLQMDFENEVNDQAFGLYRFEHEGKPYLVTQFEADDAREAFPCIDLPDQKLGLWMEIEAPTGLTVVANAPVAETTVDEEAGTQTVRFAPTRPIPTYAMALAVGPYEAIEIPDMPAHVKGQLYTVAGRTELAGPFAAEIGPALKQAEAWFGTPYPFRKLDFLGAPEFAFGAMENPGLVVFGDRLLVPADEITPDNRRRMQEVISHEIAHMWFGDLVTLKWWDDFWLNESFAEFAGNRIAYTLTGDEGFELGRVGSTQRALQTDGRATMRPVRTEIDPTRIFETTNFIAYPKGEALLTMVERWIGPEGFQQGVRTYLDRHKDGNATAADLFAALSEASGKDIGAMLTPWLDRPGGPQVDFAWTEGGLHYSQKRYLMAGAEAEADQWWTTPTRIRWEDEAGVHDAMQLLDAPEGTLAIAPQGKPKWVFPDGDGVAYMAWTLPEAELSALIDAAPEHLSAPERSALVGDLDLLTSAGALDGGQLLALMERFSGETHPSVMSDVLSAEGFVKQVLEDEHEDAWAAYVRATRRPWLDRLGLQAIEGEDPEVPELRSRLMNQLLEVGKDPSLKEHLRPIAQAFLDDESAFDPSLTWMAVMSVAKEAEPAFQDAMLAKADATENPRLRSLYLSAFAQVPGEAQRDRALVKLLDPQTPLRDSYPLFAALPGETEADKDFALDWMIANYEALAARVPPQQRAWFARAGSGCDAERWARSNAFFGAEERSTPAVDRAIAEGTETLALCQAAKKAHGAAVAAYLDQYPTEPVVDSAAPAPAAAAPGKKSAPRAPR